ncbi:MAG: hypothetical protein ACK55I_47795, partial [bacterium]
GLHHPNCSRSNPFSGEEILREARCREGVRPQASAQPRISNLVKKDASSTTQTWDAHRLEFSLGGVRRRGNPKTSGILRSEHIVVVEGRSGAARTVTRGRSKKNTP